MVFCLSNNSQVHLVVVRLALVHAQVRSAVLVQVLLVLVVLLLGVFLPVVNPLLLSLVIMFT